MIESITHAIICPAIIGRDVQRAEMLALLKRACHERGLTLLIAGEAGIGKSRLVAELTEHAREEHMTVLAGRAFETDSAVPCALLVELLRSYLANDPPEQLIQDLGESAIELLKLAPELRRLLSASHLTLSTETEPEKRRLFEALAHCFLRPMLPTLMLIEDVHWADNTSLEFLTFLARKLAPHPLLLVITYREDEVSTPLARLLAALDRERLAVEMRLSRLTKPQTEAMLRAIFAMSRPVQEDFLDALYTLTDGNPFFIEEVLKSCVAAGDIFLVGGQWGRKLLSQLHIPRSVQLAVRQRLEQLTPSAQHLLKIAAVAGQRFDFVLLQQVSEQNELAMLALIKELIAAQLVIEEAEDHFAFRHALTRQAVYLELLARERRTMHRIIAEVLEQRRMTLIDGGDDTQLPELASHLYAAGEWRKTWEYARLAGVRAQELYAPRAAIEHFTHALEAFHHLVDPDLAGLQPFDVSVLYRARGQAYETLGEFEAARSDLEQALALARNYQDRRAEWHCLLELGFLWTSRDFARAGEYYQQSLAVARLLGDPAVLAQSLNRAGNWYVNADRPHEGRAYHIEALTIFQTLNDPKGLAATYDLLVGAAHLAGDPEQSQLYYEQATALFRQLKDRRGLTSSFTWLTFRGPVVINLLTPAVPLSACQQQAEEALHLAREIQWRAGEAFAMIAVGMCLAAQGQYGEAMSLTTDAITLAQEIDHRWDSVGYIILGAIYADLGILSMAQQYLEQARQVSERHQIHFSLRNSSALLAATYLAQDKVAQAKEALAAAFGEATTAFPQQDAPPPTLAQRLFWLVTAQVAMRERKASAAFALAEALLATTGDPGLTPEKAVPRLLMLRGETLFALQRMDEAADAWQQGLQAAMIQGARPLAWRIHVLLGNLFKAKGSRQQADQHFALARSMIDALAATLPTSQLREQFLSYALALLPSPATLTPLRARKQSLDGLTAREVDVAILIQQGKSDREIAQALSLSTRTVSTHVGNILSKLDFTSRSQIAAWATSKGL